MKLNLQKRFLIPTLLATIIGITISCSFLYIQASRLLMDNIKNAIKQSVHDETVTIDAWMEDKQKDIELWASLDLYKTALKNSDIDPSVLHSANQSFIKTLKAYGDFDLIFLVKKNGLLIAASNEKITGKINVKDREYFKRSIQGETFLSNVILSKVSGHPVVVISSPVKIQGQIAGIIAASIDLGTYAAQKIDNITIGNSGFIYLAQENGDIFIHRDQTKILSDNLNNYEYGQKILEDENGVFDVREKGTEIKVAFNSMKTAPWKVIGEVDLSEIMKPVRRIGWIVILSILTTVTIIGILIFWLTQSITNPINKTIEALNQSSKQVASASDQISATSQTMAQSTTEQASNLEETSASLEELSAMTQKNAENSRQASILAEEASKSAVKGDSVMASMTTAINQIKGSSDETAKIIKTIDEIAFQTNLLALNAAVEAARAGEAGKGFAVVAEEVRNLAQRSAEAAKNTSNLIDEARQNAENGVDVSNNVASILKEIVEGIQKVTQLIQEVSVASDEQAKGLNQINNAVTQMDCVVQSNSASAEQNSSAGEELSAQAREMKNQVDHLYQIIHGKSNAQAAKPAKKQTKKKPPKKAVTPIKKVSPPPKINELADFEKTIEPVPAPASLKPEQVIPLDDDEFDDF